MILSDTIKIKYKIDTKGRNTVEMAKLLRDYGCIDQLSDMDKSNFGEQQTKVYNTAYQALYTLASELEE